MSEEEEQAEALRCLNYMILSLGFATGAGLVPYSEAEKTLEWLLKLGGE